jgi:hypothetical protein
MYEYACVILIPSTAAHLRETLPAVHLSIGQIGVRAGTSDENSSRNKATALFFRQYLHSSSSLTQDKRERIQLVNFPKLYINAVNTANCLSIFAQPTYWTGQLGTRACYATLPVMKANIRNSFPRRPGNETVISRRSCNKIPNLFLARSAACSF